MTNATVGKIDQAPRGPVLHVTFKGTESEYTVSSEVPMLANGPGDLSLLKPGVAGFVIALKHEDGELTSARLDAEKVVVAHLAAEARDPRDGRSVSSEKTSRGSIVRAAFQSGWARLPHHLAGATATRDARNAQESAAFAPRYQKFKSISQR